VQTQVRTVWVEASTPCLVHSDRQLFHRTNSIRSTVVSWYNRKQIYVALSSVEVEYMAMSQAACEAI
jgi:hypothetical protein